MVRNARNLRRPVHTRIWPLRSGAKAILVALCVGLLPTWGTMNPAHAEDGSESAWVAKFRSSPKLDDRQSAPVDAPPQVAVAPEPTKAPEQPVEAAVETAKVEPVTVETPRATPSPEPAVRRPMTDLQRLVMERSAVSRLAYEGKAETLIESIEAPGIPLPIDRGQSKLIRTKRPVTRAAVTDSEVLKVVQLSPNEFEIVGGRIGQTNLRLWFGDPNQGGKLLHYRVDVSSDKAMGDGRHVAYTELERSVNAVYPNSTVQLIPVGDGEFTVPVVIGAAPGFLARPNSHVQGRHSTLAVPGVGQSRPLIRRPCSR